MTENQLTGEAWQFYSMICDFIEETDIKECEECSNKLADALDGQNIFIGITAMSAQIVAGLAALVVAHNDRHDAGLIVADILPAIFVMMGEHCKTADEQLDKGMWP